MQSASIEQLKQQWTRRRVVTAGKSPTLRRFDGRTGTVMTVNMNGKALVQFDGDVDVAWYDLDFENLRPFTDEPAGDISTESPPAPSESSFPTPPPEAKSEANTNPTPANPSPSQPPLTTSEIIALACRQGPAR